MATNAANVNIGVSGAFSFGLTTATAPIDATTALPAADWHDVGYISADGITETRDRSTNNIVAWQNADTVRTVTTEASMTVQFVAIETNPNTLELYYGAAVDTTDGSVEIVPADSGGRRSIVLDYVDGSDLVRLYGPLAEVTDVGDLVVSSSGDPIGYDVTLTLYPGPNGYAAKKWHSALKVGP